MPKLAHNTIYPVIVLAEIENVLLEELYLDLQTPLLNNDQQREHGKLPRGISPLPEVNLYSKH